MRSRLRMLILEARPRFQGPKRGPDGNSAFPCLQHWLTSWPRAGSRPARWSSSASICSIRPSGSGSPACPGPARPYSSPRWCMAWSRAADSRCFEPLATGRIARARLAPQPDDSVPRFDYEGNVRALVEERRWPESTDRISELRLRHRLSVAARRHPHADPRHRRLSGRMAARPAAAGQELPAMVRRVPSPRRARAASAGRRTVARISGEPRSAGAAGRAGGAARRGAVHRLSRGLSRRALRHEPAAARPLSHAGRSRRLAGAHLLAAAMAGR